MPPCRRHSISECLVRNSWVRNLSNREHPCDNVLHSRRSPRMETAQGPLEHWKVASMPAEEGMPGMPSGQIVGKGMAAMKLAVRTRATEATCDWRVSTDLQL